MSRGEPVVNAANTIFLTHRIYRIYDDSVAGRGTSHTPTELTHQLTGLSSTLIDLVEFASSKASA